MNYRCPTRNAALLAALAAGGVLAQQSEKPAVLEVGQPPVVTDVGPAPAQERDSLGAVLLENSPVRAQRQAQPPGPTRVRDVARNSNRAQTELELARQKEAEAMKLYKGGAGSLIVK